MALNAGSVVVDILANTNSFNNAMSGMRQSLRGFSKQVGAIGKDLTKKLTVPIVTGMGKMIKDASDYEEIMVTLSTPNMHPQPNPRNPKQ